VKVSLPEEPLEATLGTVGLLPFEEQGETILEGEFIEVGHALLLLEGDGHAGETKFVKEFEGRML
jgi:hypothetical protein